MIPNIAEFCFYTEAKRNSEQTSISMLPPEIVDIILESLKPEDCARLAATCRHYYHQITTQNHLFSRAIPLCPRLLPENNTAYRLFILLKKRLLPITPVFPPCLTPPQIYERDQDPGWLELEDGRLAIASKNDFCVRIFDGSCKEERFRLKGHHGEILKVMELKNKELVTFSSDNSARIWNPDTGELLRTMPNWIRPTVFSLQNACFTQLSDERLLIKTMSFTINSWHFDIWNLKSGTKELSLADSTRHAFLQLKDGRLVTSTRDFSIRIVDQWTGEESLLLPGHTKSPTQFIQLDDEQLVSLSKGDGSLRTWDIATGRQLCCIGGPEYMIDLFQPLKNGLLATTCGACFDEWQDGSVVTIWDKHSGKQLFTLNGGTSRVQQIDQFSDGNIAVLAIDTPLRIYDPNTGKRLCSLGIHEGGIYFFQRLDNEQLVTTSLDNSVRFWDKDGKKELLCIWHRGILPKHVSWWGYGPFDIKQSKNGKLTTCSWPGIRHIWHLDIDQIEDLEESDSYYETKAQSYYQLFYKTLDRYSLQLSEKFNDWYNRIWP